jgi:acyl-CoA thioesterase FadM
MEAGKRQDKPVASLTRVIKLYAGEWDDWSGYMYMPAPFHFMSIGDQELFEHLGQPLTKHMELGYSIPIIHAECDYVSPAKVGAILSQRSDLYLGNRTSFHVRHEFTHEDGRVIARGRTVRVWASMREMTPMPLPSWLRALGGTSDGPSGGD